jgi:hypothetical protein
MVRETLIFVGGMITGACVMYLFESNKKAENEDNRDISSDDAIRGMSADELKDYYIQGLIDLGYPVEQRVEEEPKGTIVNPVDDEDVDDVYDDYADEDEEEDEGPIEDNPDTYYIPVSEFGKNVNYECIYWDVDTDGDCTDEEGDSLPKTSFDLIKPYTIKDILNKANEEDVKTLYLRNESHNLDIEISFDNPEETNI